MLFRLIATITEPINASLYLLTNRNKHYTLPSRNGPLTVFKGDSVIVSYGDDLGFTKKVRNVALRQDVNDETQPFLVSIYSGAGFAPEWVFSNELRKDNNFVFMLPVQTRSQVRHITRNETIQVVKNPGGANSHLTGKLGIVKYAKLKQVMPDEPGEVMESFWNVLIDVEGTKYDVESKYLQALPNCDSKTCQVFSQFGHTMLFNSTDVNKCDINEAKCSVATDKLIDVGLITTSVLSAQVNQREKQQKYLQRRCFEI